ncbi:MAG TPA: alpha/beta hydrolase [Solirubrobacteraceae bacterium]|nr:alpha/beta hydrolase [Solirubrobacteraceae bacterium]
MTESGAGTPTRARPTGTFAHSGYHLTYETHGEGPRVFVLLHGLLLDAGLNRALAQSLAARGHRVVLLELLGHGRSDRPLRATAHRMDSYADQVVALLDHLGVEQAVVGGTSLGANVALEVAAKHPTRLRAMFLEMPVLEWAAPACGAIFIPMLLAAHYGRGLVGLATRAMRRVPRTGMGPIDTFLNAGSMHPDEIASVLHGLLIGPIAPTLEERREMRQPALVIGHERDAIHPFSDASNLVRQLPNARIVRASSMLELRWRPTRLTEEIARFLDAVWQPRLAADATTAS